MNEMTERVRRLNFFVLGIVVAYTIFVQKFLSKTPLINPIIDSGIVFLTSLGFYQMLVGAIFALVGRVQLLLKLYWGRLYLDGYWSYTYVIDGDPSNNKIYFGVWRFDQTLYDTKIVGFGLSDDFIARSRVRSVTDMISNGSMYEFINTRSDSVASSNDNYSRTNMYFELNKNRLFRYPTRMRGKTIVYGGPFNGRVYNNVFVKHESALTEEDVIAELKRNFSKPAEPQSRAAAQ